MTDMCDQRGREESDLAGLRFLAAMYGRFEMRDWGLDPWQAELALNSPVFRELMRPVPGEPVGLEMVNVTAMWRAAGEPSDRMPLEWIANSWKPEDQQVADRGTEGVWTDFETAAWYASALDDRIGINCVLEMCY